MHIKGSGIGLRHPHLEEFITDSPSVDWLEVHSENFFTQSKETMILEHIRERYPLSMHGIGLSLGSADPINANHLKNLRHAIQRFQPDLVSEHLSWSSINGNFTNDLLPLPYTEESLKHFVNKVIAVQDILNRQLLIENPSSYVQYSHSTIPEWEFFNEIAKQSDCGLLLDINNVYVTCTNHKYDITQYINSIEAKYIQEIHLAGHAKRIYDGKEILIDDHGCEISEQVWQLYEITIKNLGHIPTLIERDSNIPPLSELIQESQRAKSVLCNELTYTH